MNNPNNTQHHTSEFSAQNYPTFDPHSHSQSQTTEEEQTAEITQNGESKRGIFEEKLFGFSGDASKVNLGEYPDRKSSGIALISPPLAVDVQFDVDEKMFDHQGEASKSNFAEYPEQKSSGIALISPLTVQVDVDDVDEDEKVFDHQGEASKLSLSENPEQKSSVIALISPVADIRVDFDEDKKMFDHQGEAPNLSLAENPDQKSSGIALVSPVSVDVEGDSLFAPLVSPTRRRFSKRKRGKCNVKKQQAIDRRLNRLLEKLNPIPFIPSKILDFCGHESLLRRFGLWDFAHMELNQNVRADLIAQLVATYDPKQRSSRVNGVRVGVSRTDLGRALRLPVGRKEKGKGNVEVVNLDDDDETFDEEEIGFIGDFVSIWMLLHDDTWLLPNEVLHWIRLIKDGYPEKVDWAALLWFMVEKELTQREQLEDCYYAVHLQYLIKSQCEEVFFTEEEHVKTDSDVGCKEEEDGDVKVEGAIEDQEDECVLKIPNIELSLGQDMEETEEEVVKDAEMITVEENIGEQQEDVEEDQWPLDGQNEKNDDEPSLHLFSDEEAMILDDHEEKKEESESLVYEEGNNKQNEPCSDLFNVNETMILGDHEVEKEESENLVYKEENDNVNEQPHLHLCTGKEGMILDDQEEDEEECEDLVDDRVEEHGEDQERDDEFLTGNLLQTMEMSHIPFTADLNEIGSSFGCGSRRELERGHDDIIAHQSHIGNKRPRIEEGPWDNNPLSFGTCIGQVQHMMAKARMLYEEKEQNVEQLNRNQQILLTECQKRDDVIHHLQKTKMEEIQKRDTMIYRLERELFMMGNILEGYRKALKVTRKAFADYRQRAEVVEEPMYQDAGPGGLMLSTADIDKLRREEEEHKSTCLAMERKVREADEGFAASFGMYEDKVTALSARLTRASLDVHELKELLDKRKTHHKALQVPDASTNE